MTVTIEKGIPVVARNDLPQRKYPFNQMEVGDSFLCNGLNRASVANASWQYGKNHSQKFSVRKTSDGYRCWRIQ